MIKSQDKFKSAPRTWYTQGRAAGDVFVVQSSEDGRNMMRQGMYAVRARRRPRAQLAHKEMSL